MSAPGSGMKVQVGKDAPVKQEAAGFVADDSLAAESVKEGGEFASNRGIHGEPAQKDSTESSSSSTELPPARDAASRPGNKVTSSASARSGNESSSDQGRQAPTYVENQYHRDPNPPHGKNLTEGGKEFETGKLVDGTKKAFEAEVGSENDPARDTTRKLQLKDSNVSGERRMGTGSGAAGDGTAYDALKETSA